MSNYKLSKRSLERIEGLHDDLKAVIKLAIKKTSIDFSVLEGKRTPERQKVLFESGASSTMNSRHLTGHAVDLGAYVDGGISWAWPLYDVLGVAMKEAGRELGINIEWGGDWTTFKDGPHFQLSWKEFGSISFYRLR
jgi:peptidoglycan L-alanyl-D-glutamate endopeptidase CwlK